MLEKEALNWLLESQASLLGVYDYKYDADILAQDMKIAKIHNTLITLCVEKLNANNSTKG